MKRRGPRTGRKGYFWEESPTGRDREVQGMSIKQVRLSNQAKEQLIRLKTRTGIPHWNVLCRWAFCLSLRQASPPAPLDVAADSNVEMTWQVFGGDAHEIYLAVLKERCERDGLGTSERSWPGSSGCTCTEGSATWPRRRRFGRSATWCEWRVRKAATSPGRGIRFTPENPETTCCVQKIIHHRGNRDHGENTE